jgi:hypothetical protein
MLPRRRHSGTEIAGALRLPHFFLETEMIKTLIAAAVAGTLALPLVSAAADNTSTAKQPGANPPGAASPGSSSTTVTGTDRETGAASRTNPGAGATASGFDRLDKNRDGFVSRDEGNDAAELNTRFTELDANNDGKLSREEYDVVNRGSAGSTAGSTSSPATSSMGGVQGSAPTGKGPGAQEPATRSSGAK